MDKYNKKEKNSPRCASLVLFILTSILVLILLIHMATLLFGPSKTKCTGEVCLKKYLDGAPAFNNKELARHLQKKYFHYPTGGAYNLTGVTGEDDVIKDVKQKILDHFNNKKNGKFMVFGAGNGEYKDYTLDLERDFQWTGALVEPNPVLFQEMKYKHRKADLINLGVSPFSYPLKWAFVHPTVNGIQSNEEKLLKYRKGSFKQLIQNTSESDYDTFSTQCIPIENIVYATGMTDTIDLMVLDMYNNDLDILINAQFAQLPKIEMLILISDGDDKKDLLMDFFTDSRLQIEGIVGDVEKYHVYVHLYR